MSETDFVKPLLEDEVQPQFIPYRVFMNQVDSFHAKHIAEYLTDQFYGGTKAEDATPGEGEGEGDEQMPEEFDLLKSPKTEEKHKYEIVGTLTAPYYKKSEDILYTVDEENTNFAENVMKCGYIIYDISRHESEIPKALATLALIEQDIERVKGIGKKTFSEYTEVRIFILISTIMTWAKTKPIDPEEPDVPFTEVDYRKRKAHPNFKEHIACEREVIQKGKKFKDKLKTYVVCAAHSYGYEQESFEFFFKLAWHNEKCLPVFEPGKNHVPLIHVADLARVLYKLMEMVPAKPQYILALEQSPSTLKRMVKAISRSLGQGRTKDVTTEEAFLYKDVTQKVYDRCTVNLHMEPVFITETLQIEWQSELNMTENIVKITEEFKQARNLEPIKLVIHGPPASGKTRLAKRICDLYGLRYVSVKSLIEETLDELRDNIEAERARLKAKEEKREDEEEEEDDEEAEELEEEEGNDVELWEEQIRDIQAVMSESENNKLPDEYVIRLLKTFLTKNYCQNQGFVLDGYPKTTEQAKELFGQSAEGEEEMPEEPGEENIEGTGSTKLLPTYVFTLAASDDFLCERVMRLPEKVLQGTHYTEEHMVRRLAEFRDLNHEDVSVLNFFDEIEIHPICIDAEQDTTENMDDIFEKVCAFLGPPIGFGLSPEEEHELYLVEMEKKRLDEQKAELERKILEQQGMDDYREKMEKWSDTLEKLQIEEEKILNARTQPLRSYLMKFIFPTLTKGLIEVAKIKPIDPVDFLAEYLFKENPEGKMFDPSYTRDGETLLKQCDKEIKPLLSNEVSDMI